MIIRGTTQPIYIKVPFTWANVNVFQVSFKQNGKIILTKQKNDFTYDSTTQCAYLTLSQLDTLAFDEVGVPADQSRSLVYVQARVKMSTGEVYSCEPLKERVSDVVKGGVI